MTATCAIYVRISRDRVGAGLGIERQETECRELAARLGLTVVAVYADNDLSAYSGKPRPAYLRLLAEVEAGRIGAVLAWHTDRLHRSPVELETYISVCEKHGVPTHTAKAGPLDLTSPSGRLVARQLGAVARYEVEHLIERQQAAKRQVAMSGKWGGGRRPYGYEADGVTICEAEAKVIREATDNILLGGSLRGEVKRLTAAGAVTSTGRPWTATELRKVLVRPRNAGLREHKGQVIGKAEWAGVVPEERWRAICSVLNDPARRTSFSRTRKWVLSNIATCGVCDAPLRVVLMATTQKSVPSYTCSAGKHVVRNAAELEALVDAFVIERLTRPDAIDLLQPTRPEVDLAALAAEETNLQERLDALADNLELDERTLARRSKALREKLEEVQAVKASSVQDNPLAGLVDAADPEAVWGRLDIDRRRAVIRRLMTITVHRTRKGRPPGWRPGQSYFDPRTVQIEPA